MTGVDAIKRGAFVAQLIRYQKPGLAQSLKCMLCGEKRLISQLEMHHMVSRLMVGDKTVLKYHYPIELFALICYECNHNERELKADGYEGREKLLEYSINLWGISRVREAVKQFNSRLQKPIPSVFFNYDLLKEIDNGAQD